MRLRPMPAVLAALTLVLLPCSPANAAPEPPRDKLIRTVPCYRTGCDGKDPVATGCTANAWTVQHGGVPVRARAFGGYVELRYGPGELVNDLMRGRARTCQVNWARFVARGQGAGYVVWVERESRIDGDEPDWRLTRYSGGDFGTGVSYSDEVYAPDERARACVAPSGRGGTARPAGAICTALV
ncbi:YjfA family protein [Actinomadura sp. ATCC 31491]|uniref:YjfA family protein n=1 Tax=Actinomadura luzonensis TaxID=2805427 RepID=A0ABT0G9R6_9ACTN|nr:YjfA family protein [Actinomadura luzonensis]MCK2221331.1 YjfA family protein [Actinomadura luzonensis]